MDLFDTLIELYTQQLKSTYVFQVQIKLGPKNDYIETEWDLKQISKDWNYSKQLFNCVFCTVWFKTKSVGNSPPYQKKGENNVITLIYEKIYWNLKLSINRSYNGSDEVTCIK